MKKTNCEPITHEQPSFLNGFVIGALAGAASYFLFGTKKGRRVRRKILKSTQIAWKEAEDVAGMIETKGKQIHHKVVKWQHKLEKDTAQTQLQAQTQLNNLQVKAQEVKGKFDAVQEQVKNVAAKIEHRFFHKNGRSLKK